MRSLVAIVSLLAGCQAAKSEEKGVVDDSGPPGIPTELGKADGSSNVVSVNVQSAHPYTNNLNKTFAVPLNLPFCAKEARLHFRVLRTEAEYDFVSVEPAAAGAPVQTFDGDRDDTWTDFFPIAGGVKIRLDSDVSITRHGFEIDQVEWAGLPDTCPLVKFPPCTAETVDLARPPGTCECPVAPMCAPLDAVEVRLFTARGFNRKTKHTIGNRAFETHPGPTDGPVTTEWGTVDVARVRELVRRAAIEGVLATGGYTHEPAGGVRRDEFQITAGGVAVTFVAGEGQHTAAVQSLIAEFEALFTCETSGALTCGDGFVCEEGNCAVEQSCVCPAHFDPVCGDDHRTYSNGCAAGCANVGVTHDGECGITGDMCGGFAGWACAEGFKCHGVAAHPDASGTCVARDYCDAPVDCTELAHPAVLGAWACETNTCAWKAGAQWKAVDNGRFESAHPYANGTSVWKELFLPATAQALRLSAASFALENNYDFLEVWTWMNGGWKKLARFTGNVGPAVAQEFAGRYHYLRFVSDSSVTKQGFRVDAEWR